MVAPRVKSEIVLSVEIEATGHPMMKLKENGRYEADEAESKFHALTDSMVPKRAKLNLQIIKLHIR